MILGTGSDMVDIRRIEKSLRRFGTRFENRVFTDGEQKKAHGRKKAGERIVAATYAKRFAAKEACAKALGTGLRAGTFWRNMEVINLPTGQPAMRLSGGALRRLQTMTPEGMAAAIHVSLSDDYPLASAQVIIEAVVITPSPS
ncbi:MAG: holo-ACP synthase [Pseudomonadota bacterium]|nr:holo-ACP synthase [Pseudomonadota bacterium]MDE3037049.1 holo-ACP synthase [Pseudomonadota bacterium]